jgi:peptidoglycan/xylan/chitin deacetylase (PgdA/CDA1 family)
MTSGNTLAITTSWDDGHPLDLRVAELLAKHGLRGTFYVPLENSRPTLDPANIRELARAFEIGAHTVHHIDLTTLRSDRARAEICESKAGLEEITGMQCKVFCFPKGRYIGHHLAMTAEAGFSAVRTVELMSLDHPRKENGLAVIPTTVQAYSHGPSAYLRNCMKRRRNLFTCLRYAMGGDWTSVATSMLELALLRGGVFHVWGHSWEVEEFEQWKALDRVFATLAQVSQRASCMTNSELCTHVR